MMRKSKISNTIRKLQDTSWLAQAIKDKMDVEFSKNCGSAYWNCLHVLHILVNEADDENNCNIYFNRRQLIICEIPSMVLKYGTDFDTNGMQSILRGIAERYKDDYGNYIVNVLTTHDLNSATINDISELLYKMQE